MTTKIRLFISKVIYVHHIILYSHFANALQACSRLIPGSLDVRDALRSMDLKQQVSDLQASYFKELNDFLMRPKHQHCMALCHTLLGA